MYGLLVVRDMNKLAVIVPFWKRTELTKLCFERLEDQSKRLSFDVYVSGDDKSIVPKSFNFVECANLPLGRKHNTLLKKCVDYDGVLIVGSDNFISDSIIKKYQGIDLSEPKFYGFNNNHVYSSYTKKLGTNLPYTQAGNSIGVARLWTKSALELVNYNLWGDKLNKGLDGSSKKNLLSVGVQEEILDYASHFIFGVKHGESISDPSLVDKAGRFDDTNLIYTFLGNEIAKKVFNLEVLKNKQIDNNTTMGEKATVKILQDFAHFKVGDIKEFSRVTANNLVMGGYAELSEEKQVDLSNLSLKELRALYPEIKATSVEKFLSQVNA